MKSIEKMRSNRNRIDCSKYTYKILWFRFNKFLRLFGLLGFNWLFGSTTWLFVMLFFRIRIFWGRFLLRINSITLLRTTLFRFIRKFFFALSLLLSLIKLLWILWTWNCRFLGFMNLKISRDMHFMNWCSWNVRGNNFLSLMIQIIRLMICMNW